MKKNIRTLRQKACTIANSLVKQGYSRSMAMFIAPLLNAGKAVRGYYRAVKAKGYKLIRLNPQTQKSHNKAVF